MADLQHQIDLMKIELNTYKTKYETLKIQAEKKEKKSQLKAQQLIQK